MDKTNFFYTYRGHVIFCSTVRKDSRAFRAVVEIGRFYCGTPIVIEHSPCNVLFLESGLAIHFMLARAEELIDDMLVSGRDAEKAASSK